MDDFEREIQKYKTRAIRQPNSSTWSKAKLVLLLKNPFCKWYMIERSAREPRAKSNSCFLIELLSLTHSKLLLFIWDFAFEKLLPFFCYFLVPCFCRVFRDLSAILKSNHKHTHTCFLIKKIKPLNPIISFKKKSIDVCTHMYFIVTVVFLWCPCYFPLKQEQIEEIKSKCRYRHRLESNFIEMSTSTWQMCFGLVFSSDILLPDKY